MAVNTPGCFVAGVSWPEVECRLSRAAVGVLPVGAACKAHGPHLPMDTDRTQARWLAGVLVQRANVLVWPTLGHGFYPAFVDYPGSCSLSERTFQRFAEEVLADIGRWHVPRVLVVNTGISTIPSLEQAAQALEGWLNVTVANVYEGRRYRATAAALCRQARGGHADEAETSIMLAIDPQRVDMKNAEPWLSETMEPGPFNRTDPNAPNYSPSGVYGDPTLASAEKGRVLLHAMIEDLLELLD